MAVTVMAVAACGNGAHNVDYPPGRGISADIEATHQTNPLITRGLRLRSEPYDAFPWQLDERHQSGR